MSPSSDNMQKLPMDCVPTNKTGLSLQQNPGKYPASLRRKPEPRKVLLVADYTPLDSGLRLNDASQHFGRCLYKVELRCS